MYKGENNPHDWGKGFLMKGTKRERSNIGDWVRTMWNRGQISRGWELKERAEMI